MASSSLFSKVSDWFGEKARRAKAFHEHGSWQAKLRVGLQAVAIVGGIALAIFPPSSWLGVGIVAGAMVSMAAADYGLEKWQEHDHVSSLSHSISSIEKLNDRLGDGLSKNMAGTAKGRDRFEQDAVAMTNAMAQGAEAVTMSAPLVAKSQPLLGSVLGSVGQALSGVNAAIGVWLAKKTVDQEVDVIDRLYGNDGVFYRDGEGTRTLSVHATHALLLRDMQDGDSHSDVDAMAQGLSVQQKQEMQTIQNYLDQHQAELASLHVEHDKEGFRIKDSKDENVYPVLSQDHALVSKVEQRLENTKKQAAQSKKEEHGSQKQPEQQRQASKQGMLGTVKNAMRRLRNGQQNSQNRESQAQKDNRWKQRAVQSRMAQETLQR